MGNFFDKISSHFQEYLYPIEVKDLNITYDALFNVIVNNKENCNYIDSLVNTNYLNDTIKNKTSSLAFDYFPKLNKSLAVFTTAFITSLASTQFDINYHSLNQLISNSGPEEIKHAIEYTLKIIEVTAPKLFDVIATYALLHTTRNYSILSELKSIDECTNTLKEIR